MAQSKHFLDTENEKWKEIPDSEGRYFISNLGRCLSINEGYSNTKYYKPISRQRILKQGIAKIGYGSGYAYLRPRIKGTYKSIAVHRLVAKMFVPNPENKEQVNHIDGNSLNNSSSNLEWVTAKENINHAWDSGLVKRDAVRVNDAVILSVKRLSQKGVSMKDISERIGISRSYVSSIINNKRRFQTNKAA